MRVRVSQRVLCFRGGTGRHAGLKILSATGAGSSPAGSTYFHIFAGMKNKIQWAIVAIVGIVLIVLAWMHLRPEPKPAPASKGVTYHKIYNATEDTVEVWVTLGATPGCLQDVTKIPFVTSGSGLVGSFFLAPGDSTIAYAPDSLGFNGVFSFNAQPANCPDSAQYPTGINQYEFIVNNAFQEGAPQESINISCVHGVNCVIRVDMVTKNTFNAGPSVPSVSSFANTMDRNQLNIPGVYPYGCTHCTDYIGAPSCIKLPQPVCKKATCQIQRDAKLSDGLIKVIYLGSEQPAK